MSRSFKNFRGEENLDHYYRYERRNSKEKHQMSERDKAIAAEYTRYLDDIEEEGYGLGYDSGHYSKD